MAESKPHAKVHTPWNELPFEECVRKLPQKLIDEMQRLVFSRSGASLPFKIITTQYLPTKLLAVNRATRQAFASSYYRATSFQFESALLMFKSLVSLPRDHRGMLRILMRDNQCFYRGSYGTLPTYDEHDRGWDFYYKALRKLGYSGTLYLSSVLCDGFGAEAAAARDEELTAYVNWICEEFDG